MYVDNCVTSVDSPQELDYFRNESCKLLTSAKFDLRGWCNNSYSTSIAEKDEFPFESLNIKEVPVLGLLWNTEEDTLTCDLRKLEFKDEPVTKRSILSLAHKLFDPIGFTAPLTLIPKIILQECWKIKVSWDCKLPDNIVKEFHKWKNQLFELQNVKIPRRLSEFTLHSGSLSLHVFCDACKKSYATCVFLRVKVESDVTCQLVQARSRVAPLKNITIPRLELLACCIGARLAESVKKDLNLEDVETHYWTDSMDTLYWIRTDVPWGTFVENRVREIRRLSCPNSWKFVPGNKNIADLPSRGCSAKTLLQSEWWNGPDFLKEPEERWPKSEILPNIDTINAEKRKTIVTATNVKESEKFYNKYSSYLKLLRITGWIFRFAENSKKRENDRTIGELNNKELKNAEKIILKCVQKDAFANDGNKRLNSLKTIIDDEGLIRIKTKVFMREDDFNFRLPIVLPSDYTVVKNLIYWKHKQLGHCGIQLLMSTLREEFWILKSRKTIRNAIKSCVICKRFHSKPPNVPDGLLPADRVKDAAIFEIVGADLAGPLILKDGQKTWILMVTCAIFRAVHLELLSSLSTENLILGLRRFISRRGRPSVVYTDNGTNFVGTQNLLKSIDWEKLKTESNLSSITWNFIPPSAPWYGGFWERLIGMMKRILRKVLGRTSLNYEEMVTVLCDCESVMNSRPLTYVSDDAEELSPITPMMFLQEIRQVGVADFDILDQEKFKKRLAYRNEICQNLRKRFRTEYLGQLRETSSKTKTSEALQVGDIVIIWNDNVSRIQWPLGRILKILPSKDGHARTAKLQTKSEIIIRPLKKLCPLEVNKTTEEKLTEQLKKQAPHQCVTLQTRAGRQVRVPDRFEP
nr:uncharacterized protein LOC122273094 [Parasteatoda tepidariorum]